MTHVIGIDLGTTNSVVAFLEGGKPLVMQNPEGSKTTPSVVLYQDGGEVVVGEFAKRQRMLEPLRTIYSVKRFVGCRWEESQDRRRGIEYPLIQGPEGLVSVQVDDRLLLPEQIQAEVLRKMKHTAEEYLGEEISQAVITCPAYFNDSQRQATKKAAELAGLEALRIVNEPTAAALAYGLSQRRNEKIAVFDFGGGTFDISILEIDKDVFEVKSTCGDTFLGGDAIDRILLDWVVGRIREEHGLDLTGDLQALSRIAEAVEKAKCELSTIDKTTLALPFICADAKGPKHFSSTLTREQFNGMIAPILDRLAPPCQQALKDAGLQPAQIGTVILVGGSSRIPAVQKLVRELFGQEPNHSVNPEEAVARGAAIQAGIMSGDLDEILLLDVIPLSLGIELAGGLFSPLIPRNSSIPTTAHKKFTTVRDNQTSVSIHVMQGERRIASENRTLARFRLEGIALAPREVPEIEVAFNIDANGILNVAAMDLTTGSLQQVTVESYQSCMFADVDRMLTEASTRADDDRAFLRKLAIRRRLEEMQQDFQAYLRRPDVRPLSEDQERRIRENIFRLDVALTQTDWSAIDAADRELKSIFSEIMMLSGVMLNTTAEEIVFEIIGDHPASETNAGSAAVLDPLAWAQSSSPAPGTPES